MKSRLTTQIALFVVLGFEMGCNSSSRGSMTIAGNIPLTGPIASFSGQYNRGFSMGLDDAAKAWHLDRQIFREDFQDNGGKTTTAVSVMRQQLLSSPGVYVSGTSAMSDAVLSDVNRMSIPHFLVAFDAFMTERSPNTVRIMPHFKIEAPIFLQFIRSKKATKVFFFTPNLKAYLEESDRLILPELKKMHVDFQRELYEFETKDFRTIAQKAARYRPDVIVISGYAFHVYPAIRAVRELQLMDQASVISTLDFIDLLYGEQSKEDLKGVWFTSPECEIPNRVPGYREWKARFVARFGRQPSYVDAYAYDTARILVKAFKEKGEVNVSSILRATPFDGIVGRITLDDFRELGSTLVIGYFNRDGAVEEYRPVFN
jgi:ABC-type branched-subunit amino acid transport system substrate-binding protein